MLSIQFPQPDFRIRTVESKEQIFDRIRKRWVRLTNEEWVRQNFINYLIQVKKYPASIISIEKEIIFNELKKRYDIVVYKEAKPWLIVECKEMDVQLSNNVLNQLLHYNSILIAPFIAITNGKQSFAWSIVRSDFVELKDLPDWI